MLTLSYQYYDQATFCMLKMDDEGDILKCFIDKNISKYIGTILLSDSVKAELSDKPLFESEKSYRDLFGENIADIYATKFEYKNRSQSIRVIAFMETAR